MSFNRLMGGVAASAMAVVCAYEVQAQQTTGAVRGLVVDAEGAPVAGANVLVLDTRTNGVSQATTNDLGVFNARSLRAGGPYQVTVTAAGFIGAERGGVTVQLGDTIALDFTLETGATETITVVGTQLNTGQLAIGPGTIYTADDIEGRASISRDPRDIARLDAFANVDPINGALEIAGINNRFNSFTVNGIRQNDLFGLNSSGFPAENRGPVSIDAIEQLSVSAAPFDVEFGGFTGGNVNVITKSGTNQFEGSASFFYTDDRFIGNSLSTREGDIDQTFSEETFSATFGGPIIKDRVFFFAAYDEFNRTQPLEDGPEGSGALNEEAGITLADTALITQIMNDRYGIPITDFPDFGTDSSDIKWLFKIDAEITDDHRVSLSYNSNDGNEIEERNDFEDLGMPSTSYNRSEQTESYAFELFSDWGQFVDGLSTEFKIARQVQDTGQNSIDGADFGQSLIELPSGSSISVGPDQFRHANSLSNELIQLKFKAEYAWQNHLFKAGFERDAQDVFNIFVPSSEGRYTFDNDDGCETNLGLDDGILCGIEKFEQGVADELTYNNAVTNVAEDGAAIFDYVINTLYVQDTWDVRPNLTIDAGLRYEFYTSDDDVTENQQFIDRFGFTNTQSYDGLDILLPRFGFSWEPEFQSPLLDRVTITGGVGRFAGQNTVVWVSNSYSNDGVTIDNVTVEQGDEITFNGQTFTGAELLSDVDLLNIPLPVQGQLTPGDGSVNALDPDFEIPSAWKFNFGVEKLFDFNLFGQQSNDWRLAFDVLYTENEDSARWFDPNCSVVATAPDGRPIYGNTLADGTIAFGCDDPNVSVTEDGTVVNDARERTDLVLANASDSGNSLIWSLTADKAFDNGWSFLASYTNQDIEDNSQGTSSTATSNYSDFATTDRNGVVLGTSRFEVEHNFSLQVGWRREFIEGFETRLQMFLERRSGRPFSYTFDNEGVFQGGSVTDGSSIFGQLVDDSSVFGISESRADDAGGLLYVPQTDGSGLVTATSDPLVTYADGFDFDEFNAILSSTGLIDYAGSIVPRNSDRTRWSTLVDLRIQQDIPVFGLNRFAPSVFSGQDRATFFLDIENVGNLLNDEWGLVETRPGDGSQQIVNLSQITPDGQYVFDSIAGEATSGGPNVSTRSLWQIQFGVSYRF